MNKKMKLLIAYDGSECADEMLDDLLRAGLPQEADALVITVAEMWLMPTSSEVGFVQTPPLELGETRKLASHACERIKNNFPDWEVRAKLLIGSPAGEILKSTDEWKPDLIIAGSHGRSAMGRIFFGSVSQKIAAEARYSVRIARESVRKDGPARIIIGVDGSPESNAAASAVAARSWPLNSEVMLVTAIGPLSFADANLSLMFRVVGLEKAEEVEKAELSHALAIQQPLKDILRNTGLIVSSIIKKGDPKQVLVREAEQWGANSIFIGSTGFSRLERFLFGSVSLAIITRVCCSVEIIRMAKI
jgi:nucleotide-binding universal stress UspA family protein